MKHTELKVVEIAVADLIPYAKNANIHTDEQIDQIVSSIEEFGFLDPIGVWRDPDGGVQIVEGHGRLQAAEMLSMEKVPCIFLDELTDEQRRAYSLVHNQLTRNSQFDFEILDQELDELNFDWGDLGFDDWVGSGKDEGAGKGNVSQELDLEQFGEDKFEATCPRCGMRFNP